MSAELELSAIENMLPERPPDGHKGTFGHVFILAGSRGFLGSSRLASEAALRAGAGLVTLGVPEVLADVAATFLVEVMARPLPATEAGSLAAAALEPALAFAKEKDAIVLGPGLGQHLETTEFIHGFLEKNTRPLLLDADGLNALSKQQALLAHIPAPAVFTPHPGEMARLLECTIKEVQDAREHAATTLAEKTGKTVVLKGAVTLIAAPDGKLVHSPGGNSGMATGGTGDVLSGIIGSLLGQGLKPWEAACLGVYAHGLAGDLAAEAKTERGMVASDIIRALPEAWRIMQGGKP